MQSSLCSIMSVRLEDRKPCPDLTLYALFFRYLHGVVCKNPTVTEQNRALLVETLRSISEILIWGDQNDSSVFE